MFEQAKAATSLRERGERSTARVIRREGREKYSERTREAGPLRREEGWAIGLGPSHDHGLYLVMPLLRVTRWTRECRNENGQDYVGHWAGL